MAFVDLAILIAAGYGVFKGVRSGAVQQLVGIGGFVLALILATALMDEVGAMLVASFGISSRVSTLAGFGVLMIGSLLVLGIVSRMLDKLFESARLGFVNRAVGGGIGMIRSLLVVSAVLVPLRALNVPNEATRVASPFYTPVAALLPWMWNRTGGLVDEGWRLRDRIDAMVDVPDGTSSGLPAAVPPPNPTRPQPNTRTVR